MRKVYPFVFAAILACSSISMKAASLPNVHSKYVFSDPEVKNFQGIAVQGPIQVFVKLGNTESLRMEGDADVLSTLITEVKGNVLVIRPKPSITSWSKKYEDRKIVAYITAKTITSLTMSGNSSIEVAGTINASEFTTTLSGSGRVLASVDVDKLTSVISGSGNLDIKGSAGKAEVTMSGSSHFAGRSLKVDALNARLSGSGQIDIHVDDAIDALISGSGQVRYSGNASVKKRVLGSGGVTKI